MRAVVTLFKEKLFSTLCVLKFFFKDSRCFCPAYSRVWFISHNTSYCMWVRLNYSEFSKDCVPAWLSRYSDWLRSGRYGDRIPVGTRFSAPVQTGPGDHPTSCTMGTSSFPGVKSGRGVTLTPHPLLVQWSWNGRAITLLPLWAVRPVQSLSACTRVTSTFF